MGANLDLFSQIKAHILEEPRRVHMDYWCMLKSDVHGFPSWLPESFQPPCGTVACIAGWAVFLAYPDKKDHYNANAHEISWEASRLLGIEHMNWMALFNPPSWPDDFNRRLNAEESGSIEYARVVVDRIDHFLTTGE